MIVRDPGASDHEVTVERSGPTGKPAGPVVATTAMPVVPMLVVKLTVDVVAVPNVVIDCADALVAPTARDKTNSANDTKYLCITIPPYYHTI